MKSILVFAIIAVAGFAVGCRSAGDKYATYEIKPMSDFSVDGLLITFTLDKKEYNKGEAVNAKVVFTNCSDELLHFPICLDEDRNLFFDALLIGKSKETTFVDFVGNGTFGNWECDYVKDVKVITLETGASFTLDMPSILRPHFKGFSKGFFPDSDFRMYLIYRDYSWGHNGDRGTFKGRYWRGVCISRPAEISFTSADLPDPSAEPDDKASETPGD